MKKLFILTIFMISCKKKSEPIPEPQPVQKTVSLKSYSNSLTRHINFNTGILKSFDVSAYKDTTVTEITSSNSVNFSFVALSYTTPAITSYTLSVDGNQVKTGAVANNININVNI